MRLSYYTREGHFNWADTSETSLSCNVAVYDDDGERIKVCNFTPEYDENGTDPEEIILAIEDSMKRYWSTSDDRKEMVEFLREHTDEILKGNNCYELEQIDKEIERLLLKKQALEEEQRNDA